MLRSKLHDYIERSDERHLKAIYVLLEGAEQDAAHEYDAATMAMLHQRMDSHVKGTSKSYTVEESIELIRSAKG